MRNALVRPLLLVSVVASIACAAPAVTLESLLDEMVDRDALARVPAPAYTCRQASSYDRDTVAKDRPGWFANWDRSQFVRIEEKRIDEKEVRKEHVLLDADGPGAIVRFWGTWHGPKGGPFTNGTLRVYIDGSAKPAIQGPTAETISGGAIVGPPLGYSVSPESPYAQRGHDLYLPIPYARHCKITYETEALVDQGGKKGEALYYQINYRTYEKGTAVTSFSMEEVARLRSKIDGIGERLMASGPGGGISSESAGLEGKIAPGTARSASLSGPGAIRELTLRIAAADLAQALRSTVLEI
ncbi:MAG: hypothetical protein JXP34_15940, partial [Planctomycetes bacterium]|nr:hypothetical protein [Planctomycetota bacterium]